MIFISVGHHKDAQGASYENNGHKVTEFILAEKWAELIVGLIGEEAILVPTGTLTNKVKYINDHSVAGSIAVEMHFNSAKKWKDLDNDGIVDSGEMIAIGRGSETLYMPDSISGEQAAQTVQEDLGHVMKPNRGIKEGWYQMNPKKGADYFLRKTNCTALIIEPEFIDNIDLINQNMNAACHVIAASLLEIHN